jgi:hypothetical protein
MNWFRTTLRSSLSALLHVSTVPPAPPPAEPLEGVETIRTRMIAMASTVPGERSASLALRVRYAADVQALWFMRSELMAMLARTYGEAVARDRVASLSDLFAEMLPEGLRSRPSPLASDFGDDFNSDLGPRPPPGPPGPP